jgi:hypothetical protein
MAVTGVGMHRHGYWHIHSFLSYFFSNILTRMAHGG